MRASSGFSGGADGSSQSPSCSPSSHRRVGPAAAATLSTQAFAPAYWRASSPASAESSNSAQGVRVAASPQPAMSWSSRQNRPPGIQGAYTGAVPPSRACSELRVRSQSARKPCTS